MFLGHIGVGLGLKRAAPSVNAGVLVAAALLLDMLLGLFVLAGVEEVRVPPDFASVHYFTFTFPWSHSLVATVVWSTLAGAAAWGLLRGRLGPWGAVVVALAVASHFFCDVVEHVRGLPLAGPDSPLLGLGLWKRMPLALALEGALAGLGLWLYARAARGRPPWAMALLLTLVAAVALPGQLLASAPPSTRTLAWTWLLEVPLLGLWVGWLDGRRHVSAELGRASPPPA
jgi:hypothetical protein